MSVRHPATINLQEMIKVKKLRFKDLEEKNEIQERKANFENFKSVYGHTNTSLNKTRSGSFYRYSRIRESPQFVETINVELPANFGADRAIQLVENKIKPKKAQCVPKVSREIITQHSAQSIKSVHKIPTPKVSAPELTRDQGSEVTQAQIRESQKILKSPRKYYRTIPKPPVVVKPRRRNTNTKIINVLSTIDQKLKNMQEKYFSKVQYKNVNDCCTQSGGIEVLYANENYPNVPVNDRVDQVGNEIDLPTSVSMKKLSDAVLSDYKMKERIREMNNLFPEFPKIEDTLKEIEGNLSNIIKQDIAASTEEELNPTVRQHRSRSDSKVEGMVSILNGKGLGGILQDVGGDYPLPNITEHIMRQHQSYKSERIKTLRQKIDEVEDFCDRLSEITNEDSSDGSIKEKGRPTPQHQKAWNYEPAPPQNNSNNHVEVPELETSISKSNYLSKEFSQITSKPMIKVFSEPSNQLWKERVKRHLKGGTINKEKIIDALKYTLENSMYEPVMK